MDDFGNDGEARAALRPEPPTAVERVKGEAMTKKKYKAPIQESKRPEKPTKNGHYMGLNYGFNFADGKYQVAPCVRATMDTLLKDQQGLKVFMGVQNEYFGAQFKRLAELQGEWWTETFAEYGLEGQDLVYQDGWLTPVKKKQPGGETPQKAEEK